MAEIRKNKTFPGCQNERKQIRRLLLDDLQPELGVAHFHWRKSKWFGSVFLPHTKANRTTKRRLESIVLVGRNRKQQILPVNENAVFVIAAAGGRNAEKCCSLVGC